MDSEDIRLTLETENEVCGKVTYTIYMRCSESAAALREIFTVIALIDGDVSALHR